MQELIKIIEEWPVVVQGALGSGLFALTVFLSQKIYKYTSHKVSSLSNKSRMSELNTEKIKLVMSVAKGNDKAMFAAPMLYRMSRPLIKAFIWFSLGMILGQVLGFLSIVGYLGSLYYFLAALEIISPYDYDGDPKERIKEINDEMKKLEIAHNNSSKKDSVNAASS